MMADCNAPFGIISQARIPYAVANRDQPLRILQMISKNDRYGAQRIFLDQVSILKQMGAEVIVAGRGDFGYVTDSVRDIGAPYYGISMKGVRDLLFLRRLVRNYDVDVIHTTLDRADYFGILLSKITGKPVVSTMMVPRYHVSFRFADHVVVLSRNQKDLLTAKGIGSERISIIRPGIHVERFVNPDPAKSEQWRMRLNTERFSILFSHVSSIIPRKAHDVSLDLAAACKKRGEEPLLIIIGDPLEGDYYDFLVQRIANQGLQRNVIFTGWTADVPEILSLSNFTLLPSENEALGVVLMEGMASGTPIIARDGEGGAELVEEYGTGFLYRPGDGISELAEKIIALHRDDFQNRILSEKCKNIAQSDFSLKHFGERLLSVYQGVIKKKKKTG